MRQFPPRKRLLPLSLEITIALVLKGLLLYLLWALWFAHPLSPEERAASVTRSILNH